jgi:hypothetical protein
MCWARPQEQRAKQRALGASQRRDPVPVAMRRRDPTYPGEWPGRRPPATAAGPGAGGGRRLRAGPAWCWLFPLPDGFAGDSGVALPRCPQAARCPRAGTPQAAQVTSARRGQCCAGRGVRAAVGGRSRPGHAQSWAQGWAGRSSSSAL